jgi:phospholipase/carboxylesterase
MYRDVIIIGTVILAGFQTLFAQSYKPGYDSLKGFRYFVTVKGNESNDMPMLVAFHYSSSTPEETAAYYDKLKAPVRIIFVRGNYLKRDGFSFYPPGHYKTDSLTQQQTVKATVDSVAQLLQALYDRYPVRPIVSGISQGGDISLLLAIDHSSLISASFPLLGFIHRNTFEKINKIPERHVPIHVYHGELDKIVTINYVRREIEFLKPFYRINVYSYPTVEHDISDDMENEYSTLMNKLLNSTTKD